MPDGVQQNCNNFKICLLNVRSLQRRIDELRIFCSVENYDALCLCETWLVHDVSSASISIPGYVLLRSDRQTDAHGGVCIYLRDTFQYTICNSNKDIEELWLKIVINKEKTILGVVYNPHRRFYNSFLDSLTETVSLLHPTCDQLICVGDFNIDLLKYNTPEVNKHVSFCETFDLSQVVTSPTRVTDATVSLIDHIIVSNPESVKDVDVVPFNASLDHHLVTCAFSCSKNTKKSIIYKTIRDFRVFDGGLFLEDLRRMPFNIIFTLSDVDLKLSFLNQCIIDLFDVHAPLRVVRISKNRSPWLTDVVRSFMSLRDGAHRRWKRSRSSRDFEYYKSLRNTVTNMCRSEKKLI